LLRVIKAVSEKFPAILSDEEAAPAYDYIERYKGFGQRIAPLIALMSADLMDNFLAYLAETNKVSNVVNSHDPSLGPPDETKIQEAFIKLTHACAIAMSTPPPRGQ
jgi:hypothetical protein